MSRHPLASLVLAALLLPAAGHAAPAEAKARPPWQGKLASCTLPEVPGEAYCGTYEVFENREARSGRKIPLKIVVLPAMGPERAPDPVFFLEGGPGGIWPHAPLPPGSGSLVRSEVPVLLFSGERDPVTPPEDATTVAKGFPNGLLVRIPAGTHAGAGSCQERLIADFIERGSPQGLDLSCIKAAPPLPFVTRLEPSGRVRQPDISN